MKTVASKSRSLAWGVPIFAEGSALLRSIVFAWAIGSEELGKAMMLVITVRLVEMSTDFGVDRLILQAKDGNSAKLQSELHAVSIFRGIVSALILAVFAPFPAYLFAESPSVGSFMILAIVPLLRGFAHTDFRRAERGGCYAKLAVVEVGASLAMVLCFSIVLVVADHRAIYSVLIAHAAVYLVLSHAVATRAYKAKASLEAFCRVWNFGYPLVLNAFLLFAAFYADRIIVAEAYGWTALAVFSVALQMAMLPAQIIGRSSASLCLPRLRVALCHHSFPDVWRSMLLWHGLFAATLLAGFTVTSPIVIGIIYGTDFVPSVGLAFALSAAAAMRVIRTPYSQLSIATGRTGNPARSNTARALAVLPAFALAMSGMPLIFVAATAAIGELIATFIAASLAFGDRHLFLERGVPA